MIRYDECAGDKEFVRALMTACGGSMRVAARCGLQQTAVIQWAARGRIPRKYARKIHRLIPEQFPIEIADFESLPIFR